MELLFHRVYEAAEMMTDIVIGDYDPYDELDWDSPNIDKCLSKFSKISLLVYFCFRHLTIYERRRFRKDPETVNFESMQQAFQRYAIPCMPFEDFLSRDFPHGQD